MNIIIVREHVNVTCERPNDYILDPEVESIK